MTTNNPNSKSIIVNETRAYLSQNIGRFKEIAKEAGVNVQWIYKFHNPNGKKAIKNPSAEICEKVLSQAGYEVVVIKPEQKR